MHKPTVLDEIDEAELRVAKRFLLEQCRQKFGEPNATEEKTFHRIKEFARIERMVRTILESNSWKELLAVK